jgi:hypothetical protein
MPNLFMPTVLRPQFQTIISNNLSANNAGWSGYGVVQAFGLGGLSVTKTGGRVRVTLQPPSSGANLVIASAYIGMANTAPSFDGNQVQLVRESDGATTFTLTAGGANVPVIATFRPTIGGSLLCALGITSGDMSEMTGLSTNYVSWSKSADAANAGTTTKSGYTSIASRCDSVSKIEVLN